MEAETKTVEEPITLVAAPDEQIVSSADGITSNALQLEQTNGKSTGLNESALDGCVRKPPREATTEDTFAPAVHNIVHLIRSSSCAEDWTLMYAADKSQEVDCWRNCRRCGFDILKLADPSEESLTQELSLRVLKPSQRKVIWRRTDGTFMVDNCAFIRAYPTASGAFMLFLVGMLPITAMYLLSPGYVLPLINHPIGRVMVLSCLFWLMLGSFLFSKTRGSTISQAALRVIIIFAFTLPSMFGELLSPACIQIVMALGPIVRGN